MESSRVLPLVEKGNLEVVFFGDHMLRFHDALDAKILFFWRGPWPGWNPGKVAKLLNPRWCVGTCGCCFVVEVQLSCGRPSWRSSGNCCIQKQGHEGVWHSCPMYMKLLNQAS